MAVTYGVTIGMQLDQVKQNENDKKRHHLYDNDDGNSYSDNNHNCNTDEILIADYGNDSNGSSNDARITKCSTSWTLFLSF